MNGVPIGLVTVAILLALNGCAQNGELAIRARTTSFAMGEHPVSVRIAEARSQFALGNVALALEGFRKALREDTASTEAMNGIAACYDRMSRFDLSRSYYEMALALAPGDPRLYANLARSLELQGRQSEAAGVRSELADRVAASQAVSRQVAAESNQAAVSRPELTSVQDPPVAQHTAANVKLSSWAATDLSPPVPISQADDGAAQPQTRAASSVSITLPAASPNTDTGNKARLERLSLGEVALVTSGSIRWKARPSQRPSGHGFAPSGTQYLSPGPVTLLNAARSEGLASRARTLLRLSGLRQIAIGNAPQVHGASVVIYPISRRAEALKIAGRLGFPLQSRRGTDKRLVVYLGRDATSAMRGLRW